MPSVYELIFGAGKEPVSNLLNLGQAMPKLAKLKVEEEIPGVMSITLSHELYFDKLEKYYDTNRLVSNLYQTLWSKRASINSSTIIELKCHFLISQNSFQQLKDFALTFPGKFFINTLLPHTDIQSETKALNQSLNEAHLVANNRLRMIYLSEKEPYLTKKPENSLQPFKLYVPACAAEALCWARTLKFCKENELKLSVESETVELTAELNENLREEGLYSADYSRNSLEKSASLTSFAKKIKVYKLGKQKQLNDFKNDFETFSVAESRSFEGMIIFHLKPNVSISFEENNLFFKELIKLLRTTTLNNLIIDMPINSTIDIDSLKKNIRNLYKELNQYQITTRIEFSKEMPFTEELEDCQRFITGQIKAQELSKRHGKEIILPRNLMLAPLTTARIGQLFRFDQAYLYSSINPAVFREAYHCFCNANRSHFAVVSDLYDERKTIENKRASFGALLKAASLEPEKQSLVAGIKFINTFSEENLLALSTILFNYGVDTTVRFLTELRRLERRKSLFPTIKKYFLDPCIDWSSLLDWTINSPQEISPLEAFDYIKTLSIKERRYWGDIIELFHARYKKLALSEESFNLRRLAYEHKNFFVKLKEIDPTLSTSACFMAVFKRALRYLDSNELFAVYHHFLLSLRAVTACSEEIFYKHEFQKIDTITLLDKAGKAIDQYNVDGLYQYAQSAADYAEVEIFFYRFLGTQDYAYAFEDYQRWISLFIAHNDTTRRCLLALLAMLTVGRKNFERQEKIELSLKEIKALTWESLMLVNISPERPYLSEFVSFLSYFPDFSYNELILSATKRHGLIACHAIAVRAQLNQEKDTNDFLAEINSLPQTDHKDFFILMGAFSCTDIRTIQTIFQPISKLAVFKNLISALKQVDSSCSIPVTASSLKKLVFFLQNAKSPDNIHWFLAKIGEGLPSLKFKEMSLTQTIEILRFTPESEDRLAVARAVSKLNLCDMTLGKSASPITLYNFLSSHLNADKKETKKLLAFIEFLNTWPNSERDSLLTSLFHLDYFSKIPANPNIEYLSELLIGLKSLKKDFSFIQTALPSFFSSPLPVKAQIDLVHLLDRGNLLDQLDDGLKSESNYSALKVKFGPMHFFVKSLSSWVENNNSSPIRDLFKRFEEWAYSLDKQRCSIPDLLVTFLTQDRKLTKDEKESLFETKLGFINLAILAFEDCLAGQAPTNNSFNTPFGTILDYVRRLLELLPSKDDPAKKSLKASLDILKAKNGNFKKFRLFDSHVAKAKQKATKNKTKQFLDAVKHFAEKMAGSLPKPTKRQMLDEQFLEIAEKIYHFLDETEQRLRNASSFFAPYARVKAVKIQQIRANHDKILAALLSQSKVQLRESIDGLLREENKKEICKGLKTASSSYMKGDIKEILRLYVKILEPTLKFQTDDARTAAKLEGTRSGKELSRLVSRLLAPQQENRVTYLERLNTILKNLKTRRDNAGFFKDRDAYKKKVERFESYIAQIKESIEKKTNYGIKSIDSEIRSLQLRMENDSVLYASTARFFKINSRVTLAVDIREANRMFSKF